MYLAVYHSLKTGGSYESLSSFCSIMNMPCISKTAYYNQVNIILGAQEAEAELLKAAEKLRKLLEDEDDTDRDPGDMSKGGYGITDVTVSFDSTWEKKRIHLSFWGFLCYGIKFQIC